MGPLGIPEMIVIGVLALLIFGPRKLPELGRTVGKALAEFRRASADIRLTLEEEVQAMERETREAARQIETAVALPDDAAGAGSIAPPEQAGEARTSDQEQGPEGDAKPA